MSKKLKKNERQSIIMFDVLIIGGGVSGISCVLFLRICKDKNFAAEKKVGVFTHQKSSSLQEAVLIMPMNSCRIIGLRFVSAKHQTLIPTLPHIAQIPKKKSCGLKGNLQTSR
jgi:heterodisulfide reductase subunit A-like polyferredoxin